MIVPAPQPLPATGAQPPARRQTRGEAVAPVLALDIGATQIRAGVVLPDGTLRARSASLTPAEKDGGALVAASIDLLRQSRQAHASDGGAAPVAIGISAMGPLDPARGVLLEPPNLGPRFWNVPLAEPIGAALGLPATVDLDTRVALMAERAFGAGVGFDELVYLTISTGVGGAVLSNGRLMRGPDGVAGELGHLVVDLDGPLCGCGIPGHFERLSSGSGMARSAREALEAGENAPELRRIADAIGASELKASHVSDAADAGDLTARRIVDRAVRSFAAAVVSIVDVFNPDRVIVGGGVTEAWGERLLQPARDLLATSGYRTSGRRAQVIRAALGPDVGLIGAFPLVQTALPEALNPSQHARQEVQSA